MAGQAELTVGFSVDPPGCSAGAMRLPQVTRRMTRDEVMLARGTADAYALRLRYHDDALHRRYAPEGEIAAALFESMETARCEAVGARAMPGCAGNLDAKIADEARRLGYAEITDPAQAPMAQAAGYLVRHLATGRTLPRGAQNVMELWRGFLESHAGGTLEGLEGVLGDQQAFARFARQVIEELGYGDQLGEDPDSDEEDEEQDQAEEERRSRGSGRVRRRRGGQLRPGDQVGGCARPTSAATRRRCGRPCRTRTTPTWPKILKCRTASRPSAAAAAAFRRRSRLQGLFTSLDEEIAAEDLADPAELERLRAYLDQQLEPLRGAVSRLANRLQRRLQAQQNRSWEFDLEEGTLDAGRLARVVANPMTPLELQARARHRVPRHGGDAACWTIPARCAAARSRSRRSSADVLARTLERCQVKVEILGFTTRAWKGGQSREAWLAAHRPAAARAAERPAPHRLQGGRRAMAAGAAEPRPDDERGPAEGKHRRRGAGMGAPPPDRAARGAAHPDGDLGRRAGRRLDPVGEPGELSGEAPARRDRDDRAPPAVELIAIGIGHDVTRYYSRAVTITDVEQLAGAMTEQLAALFDNDPIRLARSTPRARA